MTDPDPLNAVAPRYARVATAFVVNLAVAYAAMLALGAGHSTAPSVPAPGYLVTYWTVCALYVIAAVTRGARTA